MNPEFSIIIPTLDNLNDVQRVVASLNAQTLLPKEIVIADSSANDEIEAGIKIMVSSIPIAYLRVGRAYSFDRVKRFIFSFPILASFRNTNLSGRAFPYEATNAGSEVANHEWLAFLDATTIPLSTWLEDYWSFLCTKECDVVFGKTKYFAASRFQKILRASTYGRNSHETAPGSIIKKSNFLNGHRIMEGVRSGGDVAWKKRIKENFKYFAPKGYYLEYSSLPKKLFPTLKKFFIYQIYGSFVDIQHNIKNLYLGLLLILIFILVPKWNYIVGWNSMFFIPHITKVFFLSMLLIISSALIINRALFRSQLQKSFTLNILKSAIFLITFYCIFRWNDLVANWIEESIWYIPHITKIFLLSIVLASFVYRGVYFPIKNNIQSSYLFPLNWILVGLLGIALDVVKAPGYIFGAIIATFVRSSK
ncbi:glycosyltransferase family 2 protein [Gammaproteobacteria bacterium]|nr:glycosyltransferase family 2 protein [Gammaproteobacteria bacterium]